MVQRRRDPVRDNKGRGQFKKLDAKGARDQDGKARPQQPGCCSKAAKTCCAAAQSLWSAGGALCSGIAHPVRTAQSARDKLKAVDTGFCRAAGRACEAASDYGRRRGWRGVASDVWHGPRNLAHGAADAAAYGITRTGTFVFRLLGDRRSHQAVVPAASLMGRETTCQMIGGALGSVQTALQRAIIHGTEGQARVVALAGQAVGNLAAMEWFGLPKWRVASELVAAAGVIPKNAVEAAARAPQVLGVAASLVVGAWSGNAAKAIDILNSSVSRSLVTPWGRDLFSKQFLDKVLPQLKFTGDKENIKKAEAKKAIIGFLVRVASNFVAEFWVRSKLNVVRSGNSDQPRPFLTDGGFLDEFLEQFSNQMKVQVGTAVALAMTSFLSTLINGAIASMYDLQFDANLLRGGGREQLEINLNQVDDDWIKAQQQALYDHSMRSWMQGVTGPLGDAIIEGIPGNPKTPKFFEGKEGDPTVTAGMAMRVAVKPWIEFRGPLAQWGKEEVDQIRGAYAVWHRATKVTTELEALNGAAERGARLTPKQQEDRRKLEEEIVRDTPIYLAAAQTLDKFSRLSGADGEAFIAEFPPEDPSGDRYVFTVPGGPKLDQQVKLVGERRSSTEWLVKPDDSRGSIPPYLRSKKDDKSEALLDGRLLSLLSLQDPVAAQPGLDSKSGRPAGGNANAASDGKRPDRKGEPDGSGQEGASASAVSVASHADPGHSSPGPMVHSGASASSAGRLEGGGKASSAAATLDRADVPILAPAVELVVLPGFGAGDENLDPVRGRPVIDVNVVNAARKADGKEPQSPSSPVSPLEIVIHPPPTDRRTHDPGEGVAQDSAPSQGARRASILRPSAPEEVVELDIYKYRTEPTVDGMKRVHGPANRDLADLHRGDPVGAMGKEVTYLIDERSWAALHAAASDMQGNLRVRIDPGERRASLISSSAD